MVNPPALQQKLTVRGYGPRRIRYGVKEECLEACAGGDRLVCIALSRRGNESKKSEDKRVQCVGCNIDPSV